MSDQYVHKVSSVSQSSEVVHNCGTRAYFCEVESAFAERLYYCPACDLFFETLDDYWYDRDTVWEAEKPTLIYHEGNELRKVLEETRKELADADKPDKTVIIVVYRGCVSEVKNLPPGHDYEIQDLDVLDEENPEEE